jgi:hypothetical protein
MIVNYKLLKILSEVVQAYFKVLYHANGLK